tara:strand:- start:346 stop:810 length:465 start_codon:yes stop_codon:yes gene_type:complete
MSFFSSLFSYIISLQRFVSATEHAEIMSEINTAFQDEFGGTATTKQCLEVLAGVLMALGFVLFVFGAIETTFILPLIGFAVIFTAGTLQWCSRCHIQSTYDSKWSSVASAIDRISSVKVGARGIQYRLQKERVPVVSPRTGRFAGSLTYAYISK